MKKLFFAVFSAFAALALLISIGAYRTQAKELTSQVKISQVKDEGEKISYHWEIDNGVEVGDTFTISMPEDVKFASSAFSSMKNASGEEIATGKVSDDGKTLTITLKELKETYHSGSNGIEITRLVKTKNVLSRLVQNLQS